MKRGYLKRWGIFLIFLLSYGKEFKLFPFYDENRGKWGYKNEEGKVVIQPQFDDAYDFSEGLAGIKIDGKWGYIDNTGRIVIDPKFPYIYSFSEGLAAVLINGDTDEVGTIKGKWGYIDKTGRIVIKPKFEDASLFSEGLAKVNIGGERVHGGRFRVEGGKWGYIDKTGKFVIEPKFEDEPGDFSEGLARVLIDEKYGYIDKTGKIIIKPQFDDAYDFSEGLAAVNIGAWVDYGRGGRHATGGKWGYINKKGKFVIKPQFDEASSFLDGKARVKIDNKKFLIDTAGKIICELPEEEIKIPSIEEIEEDYKYEEEEINLPPPPEELRKKY